jgi:hypothetical protein
VRNLFIHNRLIWIVLSSCLAIVYFFTLQSVSLNIPIGDDFPAFVDITPEAVKGTLTLSDFFSQINEHRIVYDRVFWIGGIWIFNVVDFKILTLIGNFSLLLIALFFCGIQSKYKLPAGLILVFSFLFLSWVGYSNSLCSMMALQNFTFPLLIISGLWKMVNGQKLFDVLIGLLLLTVGFYTTGLGFVAIIMGLIYLLYKKQHRALIIGSVISFFSIAVYFLYYTPSPVQSNLFAGLSNPVELIKRYLAFIGGILPISGLSPLPEIILGVFLLALFSWSLFRLRAKTPHDLLIILLFYLFLAAVVVLSRFELNEYIANRFKINSAIIFAGISLLFILAIQNTMFRAIFTALLIVFTGLLNAFSYKSINDYRFWVDEFATDLLNVNHGINTTAFLPKKGNYIRNSFYNEEFQMVYSGLKETEVLKTSIQIDLNQNSVGQYQINDWEDIRTRSIKRPAVMISGSKGNPIAFLPVNHISGFCVDVFGIIESNINCNIFLVNLNP